jgi:Tol biopolymer transport system component
LAFEGTINDSPVWSPDGNRIAVRSDRAGTNRVFWQQADGSGGAEQLTDGNVGELPRSFSPDGQMLPTRKSARTRAETSGCCDWATGRSSPS